MISRSKGSPSLYVEPPYYRDFVDGGQILAPSKWWEAGNWQADPCGVRVGDTVYVFYTAYDGIWTYIGYASCAIGDYPAGLVKCDDPVISPSKVAGAPDQLIATAPQLVHLPGGAGWRCYGHGYNAAGKGNGLAWECSEESFPNGWGEAIVVLPVGGAGSYDESQAWPGVVAPPWETESGLWEFVCAGAAAAGYPWVGYRAYSTDGLTLTKDPRGPSIFPSKNPTAWDYTGALPLGTPHRHGDIWYITGQGYNETTWKPGTWATRDFFRFDRGPDNGFMTPTSGTSIEGLSITEEFATGVAEALHCRSTSFTPSPGGGTGGGVGYRIFRATCSIGL
jgi:hypothetical protein